MKPKTLKTRRRGFALIVTLSLMILLTVIAVGLLSLSSISLRSTGQGSDLSVARANAKVALMIAIGELQKSAGPDTRVTAKADIVKDTNPPVLGVWQSWMGDDHETDGTYAGRPKPPNYSDHKQAKFLGWLTSSLGVDNQEEVKVSDVPDTKTGPSKVTLLGENSVGKDDPDNRQIHLDPVLISTKKGGNAQGATKEQPNGGYAWWVSGENQKARLQQPYVPTNDTAAGWANLAKSHTVVDPAPFSLDSLFKDPSFKDPTMVSVVSKAITIKQEDFLESSDTDPTKISQKYYHDLSVNSMGLLTNTATGGWRKDLSLLSENYELSQFPASNLPFFRVSTKKDLMYTRATGSNPMPAKSLLYPWSDYRRGSMDPNSKLQPIYRFPAIGSWTNLVRYATYYRSGGGSTSVPNTQLPTANAMSTPIKAVSTDGGDAGVAEFIHSVRILPVVARIQWLYYHLVEATADKTKPGQLDIKLVVQPVVTLWNPYNVTLQAPGTISFTLSGSLPPNITYNVFGASLPKRVTLQAGDGSNANNISLTPATQATTVGAFLVPKNATYTIPGIAGFAPGETRVFSPQDATIANTNSITLKPGFKPYTQSSKNGASAVLATMPTPTTGNDKIKTSVTFDTEYSDGANGVGMYLDMSASMGRVLAYRMLYNTPLAKTFYPPLTEGDCPTVGLADAMKGAPFLSVTFGARMASNTHLPSKGFVQFSPFVNYTAMGLKGGKESTILYDYPGSQHIVNSPFEFSFQGLQNSTSPVMPNSDDKNHGFIVSGFTSGTGLSRCIIDELPGRPLASLAELQNWDARYENPVPPFSFNIIGNSDASPLFPANAVVNKTESDKKTIENLQNDDSYCLNHMLFDDWFLSTIAPDPVNFGKPASSSTMKTTYASFLGDPSKTLTNRAYRPVSQNTNSPEAISAAVVKLNDLTTWKSMAANLEVEGMFNVNSTSVKAWRTLLGHARNQKIPYVGANGNPLLSGETDYAFGRFSVAGDVEAGKSGSSGTQTSSSQYAGYRVFDSGQLDFLANEIVNQIRLRGPFLSLSEFVNRQLSSGDLAVAGAIQTALNKLAEGGRNPFTVLQTNTAQPPAPGVPAPTNKATATPLKLDAGYKFPDAAVGYNVYGLPGWTRQADVLRPLAPIMTVRDDTFTIRAYGDCRVGGVVTARAVCEATIRRCRDYVDRSNDAVTASIATGSGTVPTLLPVNNTFGRRFELVSFRWLSPEEI